MSDPSGILKVTEGGDEMAKIIKRGSSAPHGDEWGVVAEGGTVWFRWFHAAADFRDGVKTLAVLAEQGLVV